jgi:restriction system protein
MSQRSSSQPEIPAHHQMMWPTLQAVIALGGSGSNQEISDKAIEIAGYSNDQQNVLHLDGPQTEIHYRMAWARTFLKAANALENSSRGVWSITEHGRTLTEADMAAVHQQFKAQAGKKSGPKKQSKPQGKSISLDDDMAIPSELEDWRVHLLDVLQNMDPASFERLSQRILRESGFTQVVVTGKSGDGGIDGVGVLRVALLSFQVFFQCKRYKGSVGSSAIRDFRGAMVGRTDKGLFLTTGNFTVEAKREATRDGAPVLDLIDGDALCDILKNLNLGVATEMVEKVTIDSSWFNGL